MNWWPLQGKEKPPRPQEARDYVDMARLHGDMVIARPAKMDEGCAIAPSPGVRLRAFRALVKSRGRQQRWETGAAPGGMCSHLGP